MRLLKTAWFDRFANNERISDVSLIKARVARQGQGKSGGYRKLVFFRANSRAIFAFGFAKKDMANLSSADQATLKSTSKEMLNKSESEIDLLIKSGTLKKIK